MPQPKKYENRAARQKAYRQRLKQRTLPDGVVIPPCPPGCIVIPDNGFAMREYMALRGANVSHEEAARQVFAKYPPVRA